MALYPYRMQLVVDPDNPRNVVAAGSVSIYDSEDTAHTTLLALTDPSGVPIPNPITSNANGFTPPFVTTSPEVLWVSGPYTDYFQSYKGMRDEAVAAKNAAETAAATAGAEAAAVAEAAIAGATDEATAAKLAAQGSEANASAAATAAANAAGLVGAPADSAVAALINAPGSAARGALNATYAPSYAVMQDVLGKIQAGASDVSILVLSDSTGAMREPEAKSWAYRLGARLAARFPAHTIVTKEWDRAGTDTGYATYETIAGTGSRTITIWNASKAGAWLNYHLAAARVIGQIVTPAPDLILVSHGHNTNPTLGATATWQTNKFADLYVESLEAIRTYAPAAGVVLMSQNPRLSTANASEYRADVIRRISQQRGYGYIDALAAFKADGRPLTDLVSSDQLHPTEAGFILWTDAVERAFAVKIDSQTRPLPAPAYTDARPALLDNGHFLDWTGNAPNGWSVGGMTVTKETSIVDAHASSVKIVKNTTGMPRFERQMPIERVKGRTITVLARLRVEVGSGGSPALLEVSDGTTVVGADAITSNLGEWQWKVVTVTIPATATMARVQLRPNGDSSNVTTTLYVDSIHVILGSVPATGILPTAASPSAALAPSLVIPPASQGLSVTAYPAANRGHFSRFSLTVGGDFRYILWEVGVSSGNVQVGIVKLSGTGLTTFTKVADSGVIACPASGAVRTDLGVQTLTAGDYALFIWSDNTTMTTRYSGSVPAAYRWTGSIGTQVGGLVTTGSLAWGNAAAGIALEGNV